MIEKVIVEGVFDAEGRALAVATSWMSMVPEAARVTADPEYWVTEPPATMTWLLAGETKDMVEVSRPMSDVCEAVVARFTFQVEVPVFVIARR